MQWNKLLGGAKAVLRVKMHTFLSAMENFSLRVQRLCKEQTYWPFTWGESPFSKEANARRTVTLSLEMSELGGGILAIGRSYIMELPLQVKPTTKGHLPDLPEKTR